MKKNIKSLVLAVMLLCCFSCTSGFKTFKIPTEAMSPTIVKGDWFIAVPVSEIERSDIIVFKYPKDTSIWYVFRVIGLPNETVEIKNNNIYVNGNLLEEPYILPEYNQKKIKEGIYKIPDDSFFVLGDYRDNSEDSRFWGNVPKHLIYGKFYMKYFHKEEK
ncbi:MAG TPA: signal peptidase I [Pyrinomonadaceae bacterium]|jgi:signal peptidase I